MFWLIYNILFTIGYLALWPYFLLRMWRRGGYRRGFLQRFGRYDPELLQRLQARPRLWIHAVSVGEVFVALRIIREYRAQAPSTAFVLSVTTSTGHALAEQNLEPPDELIYFPMDFPLIVKRVLARLRPRGLILTEGELWPNLIHAAQARALPVVVVNGRLSAKSYRSYHQVRYFFRRTIRAVDLFCMQSRVEAERMIALGADAARVRVLNTIKYDAAAPAPEARAKASAILRAAGFREDHLILLGGSTWPGEETVLLDLYGRLKAEYPAMRLILAPRHAERTASVIKELQARPLAFVRRSALPAAASGDGAVPDVLLLDTTGELKHLYAVADIIFIGKSLTSHGGQNIIEPAQCGKAILVGPNMENFPGVMDDFLSAQALIQAPEAAALERAVRELAAQPARRDQLGARAAQVVAQRQGAAQATVAAIRPLLEKAKPDD